MGIEQSEIPVKRFQYCDTRASRLHLRDEISSVAVGAKIRTELLVHSYSNFHFPNITSYPFTVDEAISIYSYCRTTYRALYIPLRTRVTGTSYYTSFYARKSPILEQLIVKPSERV